MYASQTPRHGHADGRAGKHCACGHCLAHWPPHGRTTPHATRHATAERIPEPYRPSVLARLLTAAAPRSLELNGRA